MSTKKYNDSLFKFIKSSTTAYHTVNAVKERLLSDGYTELSERDDWALTEGGKYFVTKNGSSLIAFRYHSEYKGFVIAASHADFCSFRVKMSMESTSDVYTTVPVEKYGGMIIYSWFDRPLSVAGRVMVKCDGGVESRLVDVDRDILVIPSVAPHMNPKVNSGFAPDLAVDTIPLMAACGERVSLAEIIAEAAGVSSSDIVAHDLFLYVRESGKPLGANEDMIISPRIDNLASVFASLEAFVSTNENGMLPVLAVFDNEEVGSDTKQGAASTFLRDTLEELSESRKAYKKALSTSFMLSVDNAHAIHPNHPELADPNNAPRLNGGVVIKHNANQKYTTDAVSMSVVQTIAERCGVKTQHFYNRADVRGGSTLGSIATTRVSLPTVDIGISQLAMHSAVEVAGAYDIESIVSLISGAYSSDIDIKGRKIIIK